MERLPSRAILHVVRTPETKLADAARARLSLAIGRVAEGDRAALQQIYQLTSAKLFGICLRISADRDSAEDILQEVYVKVWNYAEKFDASRASPISWLAAIARNSAIDWRRANARPGSAGLEAAANTADTRVLADGWIEQEQRSHRIFECLDELEERQSTAIRTAFFDGLTYSQLAEQQGVPLGTMKSWVRRGLARLRECIGDG